MISLSVEAPACFTRAVVGPICAGTSSWTNRATSTTGGSAADGAACLAPTCGSRIMGIGLETRAATSQFHQGSCEKGCHSALQQPAGDGRHR